MADMPVNPTAPFEGLTFLPRSDAPIWKQIYDHIIGQVESGALAPGQQLPGETHLAAALNVTRITLRRALQQLQNEGHLTARKGVGIFVRSPPSIFSIREGRPFRDNIVTHDAPIATETLFVERKRASAAIAASLGIARAETIIHLRRVRSVSGQPIYVNDKYFPGALFPRFEEEYGKAQSVTEMFRAHGIETFRRVETRVSGGFATPEEAQVLRLTPGTPVFRVKARNENDAGTAIEWTEGCWPLTSVEFVFGAI
jgi:phosphonate metabolism transcriptional regulator PhnF